MNLSHPRPSRSDGNDNASGGVEPQDQGGPAQPDRDDGLEDDPIRYAILESLKTHEGVEKFVDDLSSQMLLAKDCNWGEMLSAAPRALCAVAQCFVASRSASDMAMLKLPSKEGFEYVHQSPQVLPQ
jgi:hypothetical protein